MLGSKGFNHGRMCHLRTYIIFLRFPHPQHHSLVTPPRVLSWLLSSRWCGSPRHLCTHLSMCAIDFPQQTQHYSRVLALGKSQFRMTQGGLCPVPGLYTVCRSSLAAPTPLLPQARRIYIHWLVQAHFTHFQVEAQGQERIQMKSF